jgi:hypothetical protein
MKGRRTIAKAVDLESPFKVPALAEPWFLAFRPDGEFHVVMSPKGLKEAGLAALGKKWAQFNFHKEFASRGSS